MNFLEVNKLHTYFQTDQGLFLKPKEPDLKAVHDVSFSLNKGETLGIVGESGSGKSTLARSILRLVPATRGHVTYRGENLLNLSNSEFRPYLKDIQMVFQNPKSSFNPKWTVFDVLKEGAENFRVYPRKAYEEKSQEMLEKVGLPPDALHRYPHEFSGGQRQRIGIARALMVQPKILIADEPVSALDLSIQAQILNLFQNIKHQFDLSMIFIAHNLAVVQYVSDRILVMYLGKVMEIAPTESLFKYKRHPYTETLIQSVLSHNPLEIRKRHFYITRGEIPSPIYPPSGCVFRTRCPKAQSICSTETPQLEEGPEGHFTACHFKNET